MPRMARAVAIGIPHHITQRGNYRQTIFECAENYSWSSARSHMQKTTDQVLSTDCYLLEEIKDCAYLEEKDDAGVANAIKEHTKTGRPCGDEGFIRKIEQIVGRRLVALPKGRPKTSK